MLTARAAEKELAVSVTTIGTAEASTTVEVRPQVTGLLPSVEFTEGQDVKKGQLLFEIDSRPFEVALRQAEAALARDTAQSDNAKAILLRSDDLLARGIVSKADHDTQAATARALVEATNSDLAQVESAKLNLQFARITAPISGRTGALVVHQGSLVRTADASPMVVINQIVPIRVVFALPGQYLTQIRAGQAETPLLASATSASGTEPPSAGHVSFIDNAIDAPTGTIKLKAEFPNDSRRLWPGELLTITVRLAVEPHAIVVPTSAVQNGQQGQYVYVVNGDRSAALRPVTVKRTDGNDAVIAEGLKAGEEVVTDGQLGLTPGARVTIKTSAGGKN